MAVGSWDKEGVIDTVDGQLSARRRKEQDIHGRKVTQHHAKTRDRPILRAGAKGTTVENDPGVAR
jgi:hypothetical protein